MKVSEPKVGEVEVKDLKWGEARKLHILNANTFWNQKDDTPVAPDKYYALLEEVKNVSGLTDEDLSKYSMIEVDMILQQVLMEYTGLAEKKRKK